jgi:hypothetical protein
MRERSRRQPALNSGFYRIDNAGFGPDHSFVCVCSGRIDVYKKHIFCPMLPLPPSVKADPRFRELESYRCVLV